MHCSNSSMWFPLCFSNPWSLPNTWIYITVSSSPPAHNPGISSLERRYFTPQKSILQIDSSTTSFSGPFRNVMAFLASHPVSKGRIDRAGRLTWGGDPRMQIEILKLLTGLKDWRCVQLTSRCFRLIKPHFLLAPKAHHAVRLLWDMGCWSGSWLTPAHSLTPWDDEAEGISFKGEKQHRLRDNTKSQQQRTRRAV